MTKVKAVIFDLDYTLEDVKAAQIEFVKHLSQSFPHLFEDLDIGTVISAFLDCTRLADEDYELGSPRTRDGHSKYFLHLLGINEEHADLITKTYIRDSHIIHLPVPGAVTTVNEINKRFKTAVITNGYSNVYERIEVIGLKGLFNSIVIGPEIGIFKPDPEIFLYTARLLNVAPSKCLNVADSYRWDVIGPKNAGMLACWYYPE
jgi:HAD superfamily hydrolase (TIGR01509 family)